MNFGAIITGIGRVVTVAATVIKTALPILKGLRPAVDEVDEAFSYVEGKIAEGGVVADDFLDENLPAIQTIEHVCGRGQVVLGEIAAMAAALRMYSQEQTPDTITPEEAADLGKRLYELRGLIDGWKPELEEGIAALAAIKTG